MKRTLTLVLLIMLVISLILNGCSEQDSKSVAGQRQEYLQEQATGIAVVYYLTADSHWLVPVTLPINATREVAQVALEKLLAGAPAEGLLSPLPENTKLISLYSIGQVIYVDLTADFLQVEPQLAQQAVACLTQTVLAQAPDCQLQILVEGERVSDLAGVDLSQPLSAALTNSALTTATPHSTCYFADQSAAYLVPQSMETAPGDPQALARQTLEQLLDGPQGSGLYPTIPAGTVIRNVTVDGSTVTVDFSAELLTVKGSAAESLLINSLYYSLTALDGVSEVQVLVEGSKRDYLPEGSDISGPLQPSATLNYCP